MISTIQIDSGRYKRSALALYQRITHDRRHIGFGTGIHRGQITPCIGNRHTAFAEWIGIEAVTVIANRTNGDGSVGFLIEWNIFEHRLPARTGMVTVEIERQRIEELQNFIICEERPVLNPVSRLGVGA